MNRITALGIVAGVFLMLPKSGIACGGHDTLSLEAYVKEAQALRPGA